MESDLISRSAVLNSIEDWMDDGTGDEFDRGYDFAMRRAMRIIRNAHAVDAVPVVRCKDCSLFIPYTEAHRKASGFDGDCAFLAGYADCDRECVHEMDFCSKGARMDGGENAAD